MGYNRYKPVRVIMWIEMCQYSEKLLSNPLHKCGVKTERVNHVSSDYRMS